MRESQVNEIMGMIYDKLDDENHMQIKDTNAPNGFYTWAQLNVVRDVLREYEVSNDTRRAADNGR